VSLVVALCVVHNFIRRHGGAGDYFNRLHVAPVLPDATSIAENQQAESASAKRQRDEIASRMWRDHQMFIRRN
jgi:hypothetical protein